jgi:DedD protein
VNQTAAKIDSNDAVCWHPEGRSDTFTRETILTGAPPASGVYGLFNFECQIFIGESANIQEALLRHESETEFHSRHLQPTGYTFELCTEELRKSKAAELMEKYRPVLQTEAALTETYFLSNDLVVNEPGVSGEILKSSADDQEFPEHERDERPKVRPPLQVKRTLTAPLVSTLIASALVIFYFGVLTDYPIRPQSRGANTAPARTETSLRSQNAPSIAAAANLAQKKANPNPAKPKADASTSAPTSMVRFAAKSASGAIDEGIQAQASPIAHSAVSADSNKKWSVQISAAPAKDTAVNLTEQLKTKGYDAYVVQAEVNGQTYHRVRVGHFGAREQAESVRQSLALQEGYRDAFLTGE